MSSWLKKLKLKYFFMRHTIVVIESDDWGYASLYDKTNYDKIKNFIKDFNSPYSYNVIENSEDIEMLYQQCSSIKDSFEQKLIFTSNFIVQEPDFEQIVQNNFTKVYFKNISYHRYKKLISNNIFFPQFHGRHHFNIIEWEKNLKDDLYDSRTLCQNKAFVLIPYNLSQYNAENAIVSEDKIVYHSKEYLKYLIRDGLKIFEEIFGFKSKSVIAPSYYKNEDCEEIYRFNGVEYIQGDDLSHLYKKNSKTVNKKTFLGYMNNGLISLVRNITFEPSRWFFLVYREYQYQRKILYLKTKREVYKGNPLVVCSHSYNYLGGLNPKMRDFSLQELNLYIKYIKKLNKETIFLTSVDLGELVSTYRVKRLNIETDDKINYLILVINLIKSKLVIFEIVYNIIINKVQRWKIKKRR
jgi:hypothetical protein